MSKLPTAKKLATGKYSIRFNGREYIAEMYDAANKSWSITPSVSDKACMGLQHAKQLIVAARY